MRTPWYHVEVLECPCWRNILSQINAKEMMWGVQMESVYNILGFSFVNVKKSGEQKKKVILIVSNQLRIW